MKVCARCGAVSDDEFDLCAADGIGLDGVFAGPRVLSGRYVVEQRLAAGAMGTVYRATHQQLGSTVAIKVMQPSAQDVHVALRRFRREARILGQIKHPNAVLVMDFDVDEQGGRSVPYLVTEHLQGRSLADAMRGRGPMGLDEVERILTPLCDAVAEAHELGIIHRDLKPANIFLERLRDGTEIVKVLDFGIAKLLARGAVDSDAAVRDQILAAIDDDDADASAETERAHDATPFTVAPGGSPTDAFAPRATLVGDDDAHTPGARTGTGRMTSIEIRRALESALDSSVQSAIDEAPLPSSGSTSAGLMIGTVPYMAHEQMTASGVSRRTDVHALAVVVFELLAGRLPYEGSDEQIIALKMADVRPSLRELDVDVPAEVDDLLQRCFALDPAERPASVHDVAEGIARAQRRTSEVDPVSTLALRMAATARVLRPFAAAVEADDAERVRDILLGAGSILTRARPLVSSARRLVSAPPQATLMQARTELEEAAAAVRPSLTIAHAPSSSSTSAFLQALWRRIEADIEAVLRVFDEPDDAPATDALSDLFGAQEAPRLGPLRARIDALLARDALDADEAIRELLELRLDELVATLGARNDDSAALARGLWRHADAILLRDLQAERGALRLFPLLSSMLMPQTAPFARVMHALKTRGSAGELVDAAIADVESSSPALRCLLLHPQHEVRALVAARIEPGDLWSVAAHRATPPTVQLTLFQQLRAHAPADHLKIFFCCVASGLRETTSVPELIAAFELVRSFFEVPSFHEDVIFEPLLELDAALRAQAQRASVLVVREHDDAARAFSSTGRTDSNQPESWRDVPLPIQRKLAREGHFVDVFVCHGNERVALETLAHLLKLDDITRFLRMSAIHRAVLLELARRKRYFRKAAPRLALLGNPKTPAAVARLHLPFVSSEQLKLVAASRDINPDVRRLILAATQRPGS